MAETVLLLPERVHGNQYVRALNPSSLMPLALSLMRGGKSIREASRTLGVDESTLREWGALPEWSPQYTQAREDSWHSMGEDIIEIADSRNGDAVLRHDKDGNPYAEFDGDNVRRSHLRVESRKWLLSKMLPKVYGEKLQVDANVQAVIAVGFARLGFRVEGE